MKLEDRHDYRLNMYRQGLTYEQIDDMLIKVAINAIAEMRRLLDEINKYGVWRPDIIERKKNNIRIIYKHPNGKFGDIDMFLAKTIGTPHKISALEYEIFVDPALYYKEIELLVGYYKQEFTANKVKQNDDNYNKEPMDFLIQTNRLWEIYYWLNIWRFGTGEYKFYNQEIYKLIHDKYIEMKKFRNEIYNMAASEGSVSSRWSSEVIAYTIIKSFYSDAIFQYQTEWLGQLSLDIYVPSKCVAIEYQGEQHYYEVSVFDGNDGLERRQMRDKRKRVLCERNGVLLLEWRFDNPLSVEWFRSELMPKIEQNKAI